MEVAKIMNDGQIRIPLAVRKALQLKDGDKGAIREENGRFYLENSAKVAFEKAIKAFEGVAKEAGFEDEDAMQAYMLEVRKQVRGY